MDKYAFLAIGLVVGAAAGFGVGYAMTLGQISSLEKQASDLQSQVALLQNQNDDLTSYKIALESSASDLQDRYDAMEANYTGLSMENSDLKAYNKELNDIVALEKELILESNKTIVFGSVPMAQFAYNLSYPGYLQIDLSAAQFGGVLVCAITNGSAIDIRDYEGLFDPMGDTFELSSTIYIYMGTGPFSKTLIMPIMPGSNNVLLVYSGDSVQSIAITLDMKYVY